MKVRDALTLVTQDRTMKLKEQARPNWRELALYSTLATCLAVANASFTAIFMF